MAIKNEIFRIIDANLNRSREGLRVCEDIARFIMNDPAITKELKTVRHGISGIVRSSPKMAKMLIEARHAGNDVGKTPLIDIELSRQNISDVFMANIERVKESIRVLEEFFKIIDNAQSVKLLRLRFEIYGIEKKAVKKLTCLMSAKKLKRA